MAKLHSYYVLCPLIDQKSFLGVSEDKHEENVVVTLGRNVVNKHRLSDQKQIGGWTSKDHITSAVIFDKEQDSYVGVFNNNTIKTWKEDTANLDKLKKYKFSSNILKLVPRVEQSALIVFSNGNCTSLSYGLENRKTLEGKSIVKESIIDVECYTHNNTDYICYITKSNQEAYEIINCPLRNELGDLEKAKLNKVKVVREDGVYVVGKLINNAENPVVYIAWSDSKMTVYDLMKKTWKTIGTVPWISTSSNISLAWMGDKHLIQFGGNIDQDGAIIVAYNTSIGVGSCRYPMKMYSDGAKIYCFHGRIIIESSNHIGMLPYVIEASRSLSSLLGSHEVAKEDRTEIAQWGSANQPEYKVDNEMRELLALGISERSICAHMLPTALETKNFTHAFELLKHFQDVPESVIALSLSQCIKSLEINQIDITNKEEFEQFIMIPKSKSKQAAMKKAGMLKRSCLTFLAYLLRIPFSDALLVPYLRDALTLDEAMFLLTYISHLLLKESDSNKDKIDFESKLFDWCTSLMDAFYQQYLMTKDEKVTYVLDNMKNLVEDLINQLMAMDSTLPMLNKLLRGKVIDDIEGSLSYSIEIMEI